ncbi:hypothetical protein TRFO_16636 [Tritrichomonas foetus]|uniref:Protein kinase domain-containing protein n=1 Tax=Tritrichomonas foetus TaxID=1144522 RepID=A0A1J4KPT4_9EUKA|nr:hypothetical protein TRFO_16636 [Tritrichomonas foetus]|eukprot:OHT13303.1 hypothetical protein TRFO_16636 [Tritrichomonas foetus]
MTIITPQRRLKKSIQETLTYSVEVRENEVFLLKVFHTFKLKCIFCSTENLNFDFITKEVNYSPIIVFSFFQNDNIFVLCSRNSCFLLKINTSHKNFPRIRDFLQNSVFSSLYRNHFQVNKKPIEYIKRIVAIPLKFEDEKSLKNVFGFSINVNDHNSRNSINNEIENDLYFFHMYLEWINDYSNLKKDGLNLDDFKYFTFDIIHLFFIRRLYYKTKYFENPTFFDFNNYLVSLKANKTSDDDGCIQTKNDNLQSDNSRNDNLPSKHKYVNIYSIDYSQYNNCQELVEFQRNEFLTVRAVGGGGVGQIYLVFHLKSHFFVALKTFNNKGNFSDERYLSEKYAYENLNHQFIVKCYGFIKKSSRNLQNHLVLQFMCFGDASSLLIEHKNCYNVKIKDFESSKILIRALYILHYFHYRNFLHRDFKLSNFLMDNNNRFFLSDFDTACINTQDHTLNKGTLYYAAPEVAEEKFYSKKLDVFSLGVLAFELFNKILIYEHYSLEQWRNMINTNELIEEYSVDTIKYPESAFRYIISNCLNNDPTKRPYSSQLLNNILISFSKIGELEKEIIQKYYQYAGIQNNYYQRMSTIFGIFRRKLKSIKSISSLIENISSNELQNNNHLSDIFHMNSSKNTHDNNRGDISDPNLYLGLSYLIQDSTHFDIDKGIHELEQLADKNSSDAQYCLGLVYSTIELRHYDINLALKYLKESSNQNNSDAQYRIGLIYIDEDQYDIEKAIYFFKKSANQGNPEAQYFLGLHYYINSSSLSDVRMAMDYFKQSAVQNHSDALCCLGLIYLDDKNNFYDKQKSFYYFKKSACLNNSDAQYHVGFHYFTIDHSKPNINKALYYFELSARENNSRAQFFVGLIYANQSFGHFNLQKSVYYLEKSANQCNSDAQRYLGIYYQDPEYDGYDLDKAIYYLTKASYQGDSEAQYMLGHIYFTLGKDHRDCSKAFYYLKQSAKRGHSTAQYNLAMIYFQEKSPNIDLNKAIYYLEQAANQDHPDALFKLGMFYNTADFHQIDKKKAIYYFKKSSILNNPLAQYHLGLIYMDKSSGHYNISKAIYYLKKSAKQNNPDAQFRLGSFYIKNKNIQDNVKKALYYLEKSVNQNHAKAQYLLGFFYLSKKKYYDAEKAIYYLEKSAENGNSDAINLLIQIYSNHKDIKTITTYMRNKWNSNYSSFQSYLDMNFLQNFDSKIFNKFVNYWSLSASQNNLFAQKYLAYLFLITGYGCCSLAKAISYLENNAKNGDLDSIIHLGAIHKDNYYGVYDIEKAQYYLLKAANQNHPDALYFLGSLHCQKKCNNNNIDFGKDLVYQSAQLNNAEALNFMGIYYWSSYGNHDVDKAIYYLELAERIESSPDTQYYLSKCYCDKFIDIMNSDFQSYKKYLNYFFKAMHYLKKLDNQNNIEAIFCLGYYRFIISNISPSSSIYYFTKCSKGNNEIYSYLACNFLGIIELLSSAENSSKNPKKWFKKGLSINQKHPLSFYYLGVMNLLYEDNEEKALQYFQEASQSNFSMGYFMN